MSKPKFDPSKPFEPSKPAFDPSKPVDAGPAGARGSTTGGAIGRAAVRGASFGASDWVNPAVEALGQMLLPESMGGGTGGRSFSENYALNQAANRRADDAVRVGNGGLSAAAEGVSAVPSMFLGGPVLKLLGKALPGTAAALGATRVAGPGTLGPLTRGQSVLRAARDSSLAGLASAGAYGANTSRAESPLGVLGDATLSGLFGGVFGGAAPLAMGGAGWMARNVGGPFLRDLRGGYVKPTPEAQRLVSEGAELTLGQMDPNSPMGRLEELASSKFTGGGVANIRNRGVATTRDALLQRVPPSGVGKPSRGAPVLQQLDEIRAAFSSGYDDILDGVRLQPDQYQGAGKWRGLVTDESLQGSAKLKGAFELAAESKGVNASEDVRRRALDWLKNEATSLAPTKSGPNAGTVEARAIQQLRTRLRDEIRELGDTGDDRATKQIYEKAEEFVSELLEGQLPPENAEKLRALDSSYRNRLAVERAAKGAKAFKEGEGGEFSATQLLEAIRKGGATPELEALTRDAHRTLTATYTPTGLQGHALNAIPLAEYGAQPLAYLVNNVPALKKHALQQLIAPGVPARLATAAGRGVENASMTSRATSPVARTLYDLLRSNGDGGELQWTVTP